MKTDKTKLLQDIEAMKEKLASMEEELNKVEVYKHFPSKGDEYYYYTITGVICNITASDNSIKPDTYKTREEAQKAYNKAVAIEKIKRRILEVQGDWKPNWTNEIAEKYCIHYDHIRSKFISSYWNIIQQDTLFPYIKNKDIA